MNFKKTAAFLAVIIMFFSIIINSRIVMATDSGNYSYFVNKDGTITISKYNGTETEVNIPSQIDGKTVTIIGQVAFNPCKFIKSITIPDSITTISSSAFSGCSELASITIPKNVNLIEDRVFDFCSKLIAIYVDSNNQNYKSIDGVLFNKDQTILVQYPAGKLETEYLIPNSVITIENSAFYECSRLESIVIPKGVETIGYSAFSGCSGLESITIPSSVITIKDTFSICEKLKEIRVDSNNLNYKSLDGILFNKDATILIRYPGAKTNTTYQIPSSVSSIRACAFWGCKNLTSAPIPDTIKTIDFGTFYGCEGFTNITIPNGVTAIEFSAFDSCKNLKNIIMPNSLTKIGEGAFNHCSSLKNIVIPKSVTNIAGNAFSHCTSLDSVYFCGDAPASFGSSDSWGMSYYNVFTNGSPNLKIYYKPNSQGFTSPTWKGYNTANYASNLEELKAGLITGLKEKQQSIVLKYIGPDNIKYGDLDGNNIINSVDLALMKRYITANISSFPTQSNVGLKNADLNDDGKVNSFDQEILKKYLLGLIDKFPASSDFSTQISKLMEATLSEDSNRYYVKTSSCYADGNSGDIIVSFNLSYN